MGSTTVEKILARQAGREQVVPGDFVAARVETLAILDSMFRHGAWRWPTRVHDADKVVLISDHVVLSGSVASATALKLAREVAAFYGIERTHFAGADQGICHQVIADHAYGLPGTILACSDSHSLSAGAFNCDARGLGWLELLKVFATGETWYRVSPTVRYELHGELRRGVAAKDVFLHLAGRWGAHDNCSIEFGGPAQSALNMDARRTLSTMCAEVSAETAIWDPDDRMIEHVSTRTDRPFEPVWPDAVADYLDVRRIDLDEVVPYVSGVDTVVHNTVPITDFHEKVRLDQCVVGSCANGTYEDLKAVAEVVKGRQVAPGVRFIVTPGSMQIYRRASADGIMNTIAASGAIVTPSACGACLALDFGALAEGEVCLTATTRNYSGRMGSPRAKIYMASPATVAASAVTGYIVGASELEDVARAGAAS